MNAPLLFHLRIWIVPAIMMVVAAVHLAQWRISNRSSWGTGAGFGMFATVDYHGSRFVRCYCVVDGEELPMQLDRQRYQESLDVRVMPTTDTIRQFARQLEKLRWEKVQGGDSGDFLAIAATGGRTIDTRIRVEVWGMALSARRKQLAGRLLHQQTVVPRGKEAEGTQ